MHLSPTARTACAALLTSLLVVSPAVAPAAGHSLQHVERSEHPRQPGQGGTVHAPVSDASAQREGEPTALGPPTRLDGPEERDGTLMVSRSARLISAAQLGGHARLGGSDQDGADTSLGGDSDPQLSASQEGTWLLGRSVDSVLGPGQWYTAEQGRTWYGAYRTFPDDFAYCVDAGLRTPHSRHFDGDQEGEAIASARSGWALDTHAQSESADVQSALSALVRLDEEIPHRHQIPPGHPSELGAAFADAAAEFAAIENDAELFAGPYTLSVDIRVRTFRALDGQFGPPLRDAAVGVDEAVDRSSSDDGTQPTSGFPLEAVVSLTSASGQPMAGHRVDLDATGARTAVDSVVTAEQPTVVALTDLDADRLVVDASAAELPATTVELHRPRGLGSDRVQAVVTAGEPTNATAQAVYERPPQPEETDQPRVELPMPRPTTLPTPSATPEPPVPTRTPEPTEEASEEPAETPSEEPEETPSTEPPAPTTAPESSPEPEVPETPSESPDSTPDVGESPTGPRPPTHRRPPRLRQWMRLRRRPRLRQWSPRRTSRTTRRVTLPRTTPCPRRSPAPARTP